MKIRLVVLANRQRDQQIDKQMSLSLPRLKNKEIKDKGKTGDLPTIVSSPK